ncbi:nuclear transport factor 2 family protein [Silvibacterium acidisoli]|uniref:nuclear transport factor 2 family protein n=1 Tax=Acidobacteriaceae bacterium ZG23-2 TaxID=2883246 RepID=UPI00406C2ECF
MPNYRLTQSRLHTAIMLSALALAGGSLVPSSAQTSSAQDHARAAVVDTVSDTLKAAEGGDARAFQSHLEPGFYIFDGGKRFDAASLLGQLEQARRSGTTFHWSVTDPDVHITGKAAWIAYINDGSMTSPSAGTRNRRWLESVFLEERSGAWKIAFWHSTPVPDPETKK